MATVNLSTSPTQIDDGTSVSVLVTNTGASDVELSRGGRLRPAQSRTVYPEGAALSAAALSGTGQVGVGRDGTQVINVRSLDFECDVSLLAKTAGNQAYNTNAALSCGAGPVICDGTNWKHLFTAATY